MSERLPAQDPLDDWQLLRLIRLCQRLLENREEALDAAQEVFLKTYRKARDLKPKGELYTWLYRVATNHCLNQLRRRRIVRFLSLPEPTEDTVLWEPSDPGPMPDQKVSAARQWQATRKAIARLPDNQRTVLILAKFEGLSYRQIADTLNISEGAVESRLFRAMRNLSRAQES